MALWKRGLDNLKNGTVLGALFGISIAYGRYLYNWLLLNIPTSWMYFGDLSIPIYLAIIGAGVGYFVDRS